MSSEEQKVKQYMAIHRFAQMSAQKVRPFADMIREKNAEDALDQLRYCPNRGARMLEKVLKSAMGNAIEQHDPAPEELRVIDVRVDGGPISRRWRPKSRGMSTVIKKRTCHISVTLE